MSDKSESGKKAAQTNLKKRGDYYPWIASLGGKSVDASKRAFSTIAGLASSASRKRYGIKEEYQVEYIVRSHGIKSGTYRTRDAARMHKRAIFQDKGVRATITRYLYDGDPIQGAYIIEAKEIW